MSKELYTSPLFLFRTTLLRATILAIVPAGAAEVVSSNVVGYSKLQMRASGYTLIANPFVDVATGNVIAINDMFAEDTTAANAGSSASNADSIEVWTGNGYQSYYLRQDSKGNHWRKTGERNKTTDTIAPYTGFFYHSLANSGSFTVTIPSPLKESAATE